jgi:hypothetical protein
MLTQFPAPNTPAYDRIVAIAHNAAGDFIPIPENQVGFEKNLKVSFVNANEVPSSAVPVGWRWGGSNLEVFYKCCGDPWVS